MSSVRQRSSKKTAIRIFELGLIIILVSVIIGTVVSARLKAPLSELSPQTVYAASSATASSKPLNWPAFGEAAIGVNGFGTLAVNGAQKPVPTASIAKLITALAVLKVKPIAAGSQGPTITLSQRDVDYFDKYSGEDGSVAQVAVGEQLTEYQALQGMLLPSANNLADSLAVWAFGSLNAYATYANQMLSGLGLTHTRVGSDASGFQPNTTSTASDLVHLGEITYANPIVSGITSQTAATIPVAGTVKNVNWLLGTAGINGLKTGNSSQAGGAFLFSALYQVPGGPKTVIVGAVMSAPTLQRAMDSAVPLLTSAQRALGYGQVLASGQAVGEYAVPWKEAVTAVTTKAVRALTWQGRPLGKPIITLRNITAPQSTQTTVGTASYTSAGLTLSSSPVKLTQAIAKPSLWWRLVHG